MAFKASVIGDVYEKSGEMCVEWEIRDFFSLKDEEGSYYDSPVFVFAQSCWCLRLRNNKDTENDKCIGVYIFRKDSGPPRTIKYDIGILENDGEKNIIFKGESKFVNRIGYGTDELYLRSVLQQYKSLLAPLDNLTVTCDLRVDIKHSTKASLFTRLWNCCCDLKKLLSAENKTDFTFQLSDSKQSGHKVILESRSDYFKKFFDNDWLENKTGEGNLSHIDGDVFKNVRAYLYSGDVEELNEGNVCNIYLAAHELQLEELKALCIENIKETMSLKIICDVLYIAEKYEDQELKEYAMIFLADNRKEVFASVEWEEFKQANLCLALSLVENLVVEKLVVKPKET